MATRAVKEVVVMGGGLMGTGIAQVLVFRRNDQSGVIPRWQHRHSRRWPWSTSARIFSTRQKRGSQRA